MIWNEIPRGEEMENKKEILEMLKAQYDLQCSEDEE